MVILNNISITKILEILSFQRMILEQTQFIEFLFCRQQSDSR